MTTNTIRTLLMIFGVILAPLVAFLGCTADSVGGNLDCSASWIPAPWNLLVAPIVGIITLTIKAVTQGGNPLDGLFKPTVVVKSTGEPGTVTMKQVESTTAGDPKR